MKYDIFYIEKFIIYKLKCFPASVVIPVSCSARFSDLEQTKELKDMLTIFSRKL